MEETALATYADYAARYGEQADADRVELMLGDASAMVLGEYERYHGRAYEPGADAAFDRSAAAVCCAMVRRVLAPPAGMAGATQFTESLGDYSHSMTFGSALGDLYLGKTDLKRLGLAGQRRGSTPYEIGGGHAPGVLL